MENTLTLNKEALQVLAHGCCFLASGGGGSLASGLNLVEALPNDTSIDIVPKEEALNDSEFYSVVVAYIGAPDAIYNLGKPEAAINAFKLMNDIAGGKIKYLVPVETGALSTLVPCVLAHWLKEEGFDVKVVDGDGAGRAVPALPMLTFAAEVPMQNEAIVSQRVSGEIIPSAILASSDNQRVEVLVKNAEAVEQIARPFISSGISGFDQAAGLAIWLMTSFLLEKALPITGTVSLAYRLGVLLQKTPTGQAYNAVLEFLKDAGLNAGLLFSGTMQKPEEVTTGGFDLVKVVIEGSANVNMHVYAQNESLVAWTTDKSHPVALAPDSICYITPDGEVLSNADIQDEHTGKSFVGKEVGVIAIQSRNELVNSPSIMASFHDSLVNLGYPSKYTPWSRLKLAD